MGMIIVALWFLLYGIGQFVGIPSIGTILAILALLAGILLLVGR